MWPQRWIGTLYSHLYAKYYNDVFSFLDILEFTKSVKMAKVALTRMKRLSLLYTFDRVGRRRLYRVGEPDLMPLTTSALVFNLDKVRQGRYGRLIGLIAAELVKRVGEIQSIVLYGSVARGVAKKDSDLDLLVLSDSNEPFGRRLDRLVTVEGCERVEEELEWLYEHGVNTHVSFLPLNAEEAKGFPPIMLDIVEDGLPLMDRGVYAPLRENLKQRLKMLGAKRVFITSEEWYWDLKPDLKFGEVFAL